MKIVLAALVAAMPLLAMATDAGDSEQIRRAIERAGNKPKKCVMAQARKPEDAPASAPDPDHRDIREVDLEEADNPERLGEEVNLHLEDCPSPEKKKALETPVGR